MEFRVRWKKAGWPILTCLLQRVRSTSGQVVALMAGDLLKVGMLTEHCVEAVSGTAELLGLSV